MRKPSRLGEKFSILGFPTWDEFFPRQLCEKCELAWKCGADEYCAAVSAIGLAGHLASGDRESARKFADCFKTASAVVEVVNATSIDMIF